MISTIHYNVHAQSSDKNKPPIQARWNTYHRFLFRNDIAADTINTGNILYVAQQTRIWLQCFMTSDIITCHWHAGSTYPYPKPNACIVEVWEWIRDFFPHFIMSVTTYSRTFLWSFPRRALKRKYHRDDFAITVIPWLILTCMNLFNSAFYISVKYFLSVWKKSVLALITMTS